jgi:hypothetical protein
MKKLSKKVFVLMFLAIVSSQTSYAAKLGVVGVLDYNLASSTTTVSGFSAELSGGLGFGAGLLVHFGSSISGLDLGAFFISQKSTVTLTGVASGVSSSSSVIHFPLTYQIGLGKSLALGLGGYYGLSLESGGSSDYGAKAGLRVMLGNKLFTDVSYNYGLKTLDSGVKNSEIIGLIGIFF